MVINGGGVVINGACVTTHCSKIVESKRRGEESIGDGETVRCSC